MTNDHSLTRLHCASLQSSGLTPDSLRYFFAVADNASFTRAAETLGVEVACVSRKVKGLEERLGVRLFERNHGKVEMTHPGRILYTRSREFLVSSQRTINAVRAASAATPSVIRIAYVSSAVLSGQLQSMTTGFTRLHSQIRFTVSEEKMDRIPELVDTGCVDVGIVRLPVAPAGKLRSVQLCDDRFCVALPRNHALGTREAISALELGGEQFVLPEQISGTHELGRIGGFEPDCVSQPGSLLSVLTEVALGKGVAIVPETVVQALSVPGVIYRPLREEIAVSGLFALFRRRQNARHIDSFHDYALQDSTLGCGGCISTISKSAFPKPQSGHSNSSGMLLQAVPGASPSSGRPAASS